MRATLKHRVIAESDDIVDGARLSLFPELPSCSD